MINNKTNTQKQLNMKNKVLLTGAALAVATGLSSFIGASQVSADTVDNSTYQVKSGDTLWGIALAHNLDLNNFEAANGKSATDTLIHVGDVLKLTESTSTVVNTTQATTATTTAQAQVSAPVAQTDTTTQTQATQTTEQATQATTYTAPATTTTTTYSTTGGDKAAARRQIENSGSYNWNTGNGYYGAYQFAPSTWTAYAQKAGVDVNDHSAAAQDKVADAYAQGAYGGWANTPSQGGW